MTDEPLNPGPADAKPGHNTPDGVPTLLPMLDSLPTVDDLVALLTAAHQGALDRVAEIEAKGAKYFTINSDEEDSRATEFLVPIRTRFKTSEADRVATKTRFDDLAGAVQAFFKSGILDKLGAAPSNKTEEFDPMTSDQYGVGPRITMAQTLYKRRKVAEEKKRREDEAARLRKIEDDARAVREAEAKRIKDEADRIAKAAKDKADAEAAERKRVADLAAKEAADLAAVAARKRSEKNKEAADAAAAEAARIAEQARKDQEEADRVAAAEQAERDRVAQQEQETRDAADREEENRLAEERSAAEESAAASTADLSRSRGGKGGVASLKEFVDFRDLDRDKLGDCTRPDPSGNMADRKPPSICLLLPFIKDAALEAAVKDFAKANQHLVKTGIKSGQQPIHGVVYFLNTKSGGRS